MARTDDNRVMRKRDPLATCGGRWAYLALVLAFLGSTFAAGTHWLSVPHRLCEVHGTLEHGFGGEIGSGPLSPAPLPDGTPVVTGEGQSHEECELGPCARTEALLLPRTGEQGRFTGEERGRTFVPQHASPSVPLLLLAPSRSPPA